MSWFLKVGFSQARDFVLFTCNNILEALCLGARGSVGGGRCSEGGSKAIIGWGATPMIQVGCEGDAYTAGWVRTEVVGF